MAPAGGPCAVGTAGTSSIDNLSWADSKVLVDRLSFVEVETKGLTACVELSCTDKSCMVECKPSVFAVRSSDAVAALVAAIPGYEASAVV